MASDPEIRELSAQPAVTEVAVTDADGIPSVADAAFPRLFGRLAELGVELAGPAYIRYLRHVGPFSGLRDACARLHEWAGDRAVGPFWESYVTNPREEPDSSRWVTEIFLPLR
jgi:effector-binding domain-containing protein